MARRLTIVAFAPMFILSFAAAASAKGKAVAAQPEEAQPAEATAPPTEAAVQPAEAQAPPAAEAAVAAEGAAVMRPVNPPQFGGAFRARWITLPNWFLGMFTKANRALSSYGVGFEGFRRKRDAENPNRYWEISLGVGYQNMSPPDGNWLGKGHDASVDTNWVQFKNFGFWTVDFSFLQRQYFNDVFGIHYGAGLGLAIIQGDILRTKSSYGCTDQNLSTCRPIVCTGGVCTEAELASTQQPSRTPGSPDVPYRFREGSVPGAIPILNLIFGLDFRVPQVRGLEFRIDAGFFDALFLGGGVGYLFP
jgi:hypothetical protein